MARVEQEKLLAADNAALDTIHKITPTPHNFRTLGRENEVENKDTLNTIEKPSERQVDAVTALNNRAS